jgi:hypothetical protein
VAGKFEIKFDQARLREAKAAFKFIAASLDPAKTQSLTSLWKLAQDEVQSGFRAAAVMVRDKARAYAAGKGVPKRLYSGARPAIFAFTDFAAGRDDKRKRSALVGVRTGLATAAKDPSLYVQWGIGSRRKNGSIAGRGLSMSLAAIFERGTQNRRIKPIRYFRGAIYATRGKVLTKLAEAYRLAGYKLNGKDLAA